VAQLVFSGLPEAIMKRHLIRYYLPAFSIAASLLLAGCYTQLAVQGEDDNPPDVGTVEAPPPVYYPVYVPDPVPAVVIVVPFSGSDSRTDVSTPPQRTSGVRRAGDSNGVSNTSSSAPRTTETERTAPASSNVGVSRPSSPTPPPANAQTSGSNRSSGASRSGR
jgi:hypothetical protein